MATVPCSASGEGTLFAKFCGIEDDDNGSCLAEDVVAVT